MCKIKKLILHTTKGNRQLQFYDFSYVYGQHDKGKTILLNLIDYMMGDSTYNFTDKNSMKNVESISLILENENETLYLNRNGKEFFYKTNEFDNYLRLVSIEDYKSKILYFILKANTSGIDEYKKITEKKLGHRSFSLFNYLPEYGIGDITNIFPKSKEIGESMIVRPLMSFLFNRNNATTIYKLILENEKLERELQHLRLENDGNTYCEKIIRENMAKLSLENTGMIKDLKDIFDSYVSDFYSSNLNPKSKDYMYLIKTSLRLSEEIKYQIFLSKQSKNEVHNIKNSKKLLNQISNIINDNNDYSYVGEILKKTLSDFENDLNFLDIKDYNKSINNLQEQKNNIDQEIAQINIGLNEMPYDEKLKIIHSLEEAFAHFSTNNNESKINNYLQKIKQNNNRINELNNQYDKNSIEQFNNIATEIYKSFSSIQFVDNDCKNNGFRLTFNPTKVSLSAFVKETDNDGEVVEKAYLPGSKARMTLWQLVTYMSMSVFLLSNYKDIPYIPYVCIDGVVQEFADANDNTTELIKLLHDFAKKYNIQIILTGSVFQNNLDTKEVVNIDNGLNPAYKDA